MICYLNSHVAKFKKENRDLLLFSFWVSILLNLMLMASDYLEGFVKVYV